MDLEPPFSERESDTTSTDAQLEDRSASGKFGEELDCRVEHVGSEPVRTQLIVSRGDFFAEVIL